MGKQRIPDKNVRGYLYFRDFGAIFVGLWTVNFASGLQTSRLTSIPSTDLYRNPSLLVLRGHKDRLEERLYKHSPLCAVH